MVDVKEIVEKKKKVKVECPYCGNIFEDTPAKVWMFKAGAPKEKSGETKYAPLLMGTFTCPKCGIKFRSKIKVLTKKEIEYMEKRKEKGK